MFQRAADEAVAFAHHPMMLLLLLEARELVNHMETGGRLGHSRLDRLLSEIAVIRQFYLQTVASQPPPPAEAAAATAGWEWALD